MFFKLKFLNFYFLIITYFINILQKSLHDKYNFYRNIIRSKKIMFIVLIITYFLYDLFFNVLQKSLHNKYNFIICKK